MPIQSIIDVVRPLLVQLEAAQSVASKYSRYSNIDKIIKDVVEEINSLKQEIHKLEIWEKDIKDKFAYIARDIDKALEAGNDENELTNKITVVRETTSKVKESISANSPLLQKRLDDYVKSLSNGLVDNDADDAQDCQFVTIKSIVEVEEDVRGALDDRAKKMLYFLCIFPSDSWIKIKTVVYPWWRFHHYMNIKELYNDLELLEKRGYIKCKYKEYNKRRSDQCMLNPSAKEAFMNLVADADVIEMYGQKMVIGISYPLRQQCINVNIDCLQPSMQFFDTVIDFKFMMLGKWHNSVKHHHIEVANDEFVKWLMKLKSLEYLNLSGISRILTLPLEISNLRRLRFLDLRACYDLQTLPVEITILRFLQYLDVSECHFLTHMPRGIDDLFDLKVLKGFVVESTQRYDVCELGDLSKLKNLEKLSLVIGHNSILDLREFSKLSSLERLRSLTITWAGVRSQTDYRDVTLPPNLEKLDLRCFRERELPTWLAPNNFSMLERLYIRGGRVNVAKLWGAGLRWSNLKVLRLRYLQEVEAMDMEKVDTAFPNIEYIEFYKCNNFQLNCRWTK